VEDVGAGREKTKSGLGGQGIFTIDGVTFGLEVCLDHDKHRLRASPPAVGDNYVQIHLITSASSDIDDEGVACMQGGLIFNVDGGSPHSHVNRNIETYDKPKLQYGGYPNAIGLEETIPIDLGRIARRWSDYFTEEGHIHVFKKQGFPKARTK